MIRSATPVRRPVEKPATDDSRFKKGKEAMVTKWRSLVMAAAIAVGLGFCSNAKAGPMSFSYSGTPAFQIINPNAPAGGNGGIFFAANSGVGNGPNGGATGATLSAPSSSTGVVGTFNNAAFTTGVTITDTTSSASHTFNFGGVFNGTLATGTNTLSSSFTGLTTQQFQLGSNMYSVTINNLSLPGMQSSGYVSYNVNVAAAGVQSTPEPSTLLLSGLGAGCLGIFSWRRRRNANALVSAAA
jgi:hypothetical protein